MLLSRPLTHLVGYAPDDMLVRLSAEDPAGVRAALEGARAAVDWCKREIAPYQAAALYLLARPFDGRAILEVGTALGYSAAVLAQACPRSEVVTLNPKHTEYKQALGYLKGYANVEVEPCTSAEYLECSRPKALGLVFVDGSHILEDVRVDCHWFDRLATGGLVLFHDYSPEESKRPAPGAYQAIGEFEARLGRVPDVLIVDSGQVGMAGWYKRDGEEVRA